MKTWLLEILVCPACLPREVRLEAAAGKESNGDLIQGHLLCPGCQARHPVRDGIAHVLPEPVHPDKIDPKYETDSVVASYLWSHYADLLGDPEGSDAYVEWTGLMRPGEGMCLDIGSAVGRFTFEAARQYDYAVGIDNSAAFIRTSRELMVNCVKEFELAEEGALTIEKRLELPRHWKMDRVEFIVADAMALPFASETFSALASLNMVDKLPKPIEHLKEVNRLASKGRSQFLLSDPFSWSPASADRADWLGGKNDGDFSGYGMDNITAWLKDENGRSGTPWNIETHGSVWWKIRTHRNHFELIRSCYVKARR